MNMIAVDDERGSLINLKEAVERAAPSASLKCFSTGREAILYASQNPVDVAFLDVQMPEINGLELARRLKELKGRKLNIIFTTGYNQYAKQAFSLHASGYLSKPVRREDVEMELEYLRYPPDKKEEGIYVHTFGNFDVLVDGHPVTFHRTKSKEVLAYLVDRRGATVTKKEIAAVLWEDGQYTRNRQFQLQTLLTEMVKSLREAGAEKMIRKNYNSFSVDPSTFECDYYQFAKGDIEAVNAYCGEYMTNYSWAEFTTGDIMKRKKGK